MHTLGIDVGSTNTKVVLVDDDGDVVAAASRRLETVRTADTVVQDADLLWAAVAAAVREVTSAAPGAAADVGAIGVCSQYSSIVPVDAAGVAVGPLLMYLDHRGTDACWAIMQRHPEAFERFVDHHGIPPIGSGLSLGHLLHLQLGEPELHHRTATHLEVMDLVNLRLTGRAVATQCTMFASQLCDNRVVGTRSYDDELLALSGVDASRLPPLIDLDAEVGTVAADVAEDLGLPAGVSVRAGMNDTQSAALATGVLGPGGTTGHHRVGLVIGTTAVLVDAAPAHRVDLDHEVLTMPSPVPGRHLVMAENGVAGRAVEHTLELLRPAGSAGAARSPSAFDELAAALAGSRPGAGGVLFLPWLAGSMSPAAQTSMRGGFLGVSLDTTREDLLRATLEGTAHNLRWLLPAVEALAGAPADEVVFGGGAARSDEWAQVLADVLGRPVHVLVRPELAAATAVAITARCRLRGEDPVAGARLPTGARHEPDPASAEVHQRLHEQFVAAFEANRAICEALAHE